MPAEISFPAAEQTTSNPHPETPNQKNLIESNKKYTANFTQGDLELSPANKYAIVTCMDARIDPSSAFGIPLGDAHVIRNAGGSAREALRSLIISQQLLGTNEIILVKHTGCGMLSFSNEDAVGIVKKRLGEEAERELRVFGGEFLPFGNLEGEVRRDVGWLRGRRVLDREMVVSGWVYEVESGRVKRVV